MREDKGIQKKHTKFFMFLKKKKKQKLEEEIKTESTSEYFLLLSLPKSRDSSCYNHILSNRRALLYYCHTAADPQLVISDCRASIFA